MRHPWTLPGLLVLESHNPCEMTHDNLVMNISHFLKRLLLPRTETGRMVMGAGDFAGGGTELVTFFQNAGSLHPLPVLAILGTLTGMRFIGAGVDHFVERRPRGPQGHGDPEGTAQQRAADFREAEAIWAATGETNNE
jgi:hypothetical protein